MVAVGGLLTPQPRAAPLADLTFETEDWTFRAPDALGTQADLELTARQVQLCTDEIKKLIDYRPRNVAKFSMVWRIGGRIAYAEPTGVTNLVPDESWRLVDPATRSFKESLVAASRCFGPHEVTHVLTWESWGALLWANEGFAEFTDRLYDSTLWRCCSQPLSVSFSCDADGFVWAGTRHRYANLRSFVPSIDAYHTAACFWFETYSRGGFPAIRRILRRMRASPPRTTGELVVHHASVVLGTDMRPIAKRYGFTDDDLAVSGPAPAEPAPRLAASPMRRSPAAVRAGARLRAEVTVTRTDASEGVEGAEVLCAARVGRLRATVLRAEFRGARAVCVWRVPRSAKRKRLSGSITVSLLGASVRRAFSVVVR